MKGASESRLSLLGAGYAKGALGCIPSTTSSPNSPCRSGREGGPKEGWESGGGIGQGVVNGAANTDGGGKSEIKKAKNAGGTGSFIRKDVPCECHRPAEGRRLGESCGWRKGAVNSRTRPDRKRGTYGGKSEYPRPLLENHQLLSRKVLKLQIMRRLRKGIPIHCQIGYHSREESLDNQTAGQ